jgi:hypothetical protein
LVAIVVSLMNLNNADANHLRLIWIKAFLAVPFGVATAADRGHHFVIRTFWQVRGPKAWREYSISALEPALVLLSGKSERRLRTTVLGMTPPNRGR